jgi:hypothetical protein
MKRILILKPVKKLNQTAQESEWRETWYGDNVQVWGRIAKDAEDSQIIPLLHSSQQSGNQQFQRGGHYNQHNQPKKAQNQSIPLALQKASKPMSQSSKPFIYRTCVTGRVKDTNKSDDQTAIGRLWHRMYPLNDGRYLEIITIFPKGCAEATPFIQWLSSQKKPQNNSQKEWEQLW